MTNTLAIDAEGLERLSCNAKSDPSTGKKTLKAKTVCEAGFRNMTYVRNLAPVPVGEPPALLGDDCAPNPSETALAALGSCISVGLLANATHRGVTLTKIQIEMEGDIDISAVWVSATSQTERYRALPRSAARSPLSAMLTRRRCSRSTTTRLFGRLLSIRSDVPRPSTQRLSSSDGVVAGMTP